MRKLRAWLRLPGVAVILVTSGSLLAARHAAARRARIPATTGFVEGLHVAGLWAVAVAQPLYDLLGRSPEFFVAHDTRPLDLLALVLILGMAGPACCVAVTRLCHRIGPGAHALAAGGIVGTLVAALALVAIRLLPDWSREASFGAAAACGALAGGGYVWLSAARLFATFLSPAALVVPALFLLQPAVAPLLSPSRADTGTGAIDIAFGAPPPPVVVAVFDQLPLVSLLDGDASIDRKLYPNFAALADEATWFRNASAVAGWTAAALPAMVTGNYPTSGRLPSAADHPENLFTLLGAQYELHVLEPLTDLCPETLCEPDRPGAAAWLAAVLSDLAVVYLQAALPRDLATSLPPVTQSWRDFAAEDTFGGRWRTDRTSDRDAAATDFIDAIRSDSGGSRSTLHFMHLLLPHEPWLYLPTGQRHSLHRHIVGGSAGLWSEDVWAVTVNYQRHLLQVQYVDAVLGKLVERLHDAGIYDHALLVVTSDHGASLRPGAPFRRPTDETFADIAAVPLLIKQPGQRQARVSEANVESIDILPTIAAVLGVPVPWDTDGSDAFAEHEARRSVKTMVVSGKSVEAPADLGEPVAESVARKLAMFENGNPVRPRLGVHDDLVGARIADLRPERHADFDAIVNSTFLLRDIDLDAPFVPAHLTGGIVGGEGNAPIPPLAIAVNGVVAAVTRTYPFRAFGQARPWEALVDPRLFVSGANGVGVFAIKTDSTGAVVLEEAYAAGATAEPINLASEETQQVLGIAASGFQRPEQSANGPYRWTSERAHLSVPVDQDAQPRALFIGIRATGRWHKRLQVMVNGCTVFEGPILGRWEETFALDRCLMDSSIVEIELLSNVHLSRDERQQRLGVAVSAIELLY